MIGSFLALLLSAALAYAADAPSPSVPSSDWMLSGPFGGTARSIAVDPQKPSVVLAGGMNSLLYRSKDGGQTWDLLNFPKRNLSEVTSILVDPADSSHYLAGMITAEGGGLWESKDEGQTWAEVKDVSRFGVRALAAAPSKPARFLAGTLQGVWLSDDSGANWKRMSDAENLEMGGITVVAIDSQNPDIFYAGTSHLPWRSLDGGKTWESIHNGMIDDSDVFSIYVNPATPTELLASACSGIYATSTRGDQWRKLMGIPNTSRRTHVIRQDPLSASTIFAGTTTGLFKSTNAGSTWRTLSGTQANAMAFDLSHPGNLYLALEYEGIGKSENGGDQIRPANQGFVDRAITSVTRSGNKFFAIETQEGSTSGVFASTDKGQTWSQLQDVRGLDGVHLKTVAGLPSSPNVLLAASPRQLYKSVDGANLWKPLRFNVIETITPAAPKAVASRSRSSRGVAAAKNRTARVPKPITRIHEITPYEISGLYSVKLGTQDAIFAATDLGLLKSLDAGERWVMLPMLGSPAVTAVYFSPDPDGSMIARAATGLFISKDCGDHWESFSFPLPVSDVNEIAIAGGKSSALLAATRVGIYSSVDGGANWTLNKGNFPASTVSSVIFSGDGGGAFAVQYGRLFETTDAGDSWTALPSAIPGLRIKQLWMPDLASGRLYGITSDLGILFREGARIR